MREREVEFLTRKIRKHIGTIEFHPHVVYHEELDAIEVVTEDCSFSQKKISRKNPVWEFSLLERNHLENGLQHIGFFLDGARMFCNESGLPIHGKVSVSAILKKLAEENPSSQPAILDVALPLLEDNNLDEVVFPS